MVSQAEVTLKTCAEIVKSLLEAHEKGQNVNLNELKANVSRKNGSKTVPRLVDIISAVPQEYRDALLPKLRAKPVRTASGIAIVAVMSKPHRCPHIAMTGNICVSVPCTVTVAKQY